MTSDSVFLLLDKIGAHEPSLVKIILDFVFIPCYENKRKYKFIRAIPKPGTDFIDTCAFDYNEDLKGVIIDSQVKTVKEGAFIYCKNLEFIDLGSVEILSDSSFQNCQNLFLDAF